MINDIFYILNYPAWLILFFTLISLILSVILRIKVGVKHIKIGSGLVLFSATIISFNYEPSVYTDLYRYFNTLDIMRATGMAFYNPQEVVSALLFELVSKTNYNSLLPFVASLIRYSVFFIILFKYIKSENSTSFDIRMFLIFHLGFFPIIESISGVRYYLSITFLFASMLYGLKLNKKFNEIVFAILGLFTHTASIIYIGLRILVIDKIYRFIKPFRWLIVFWPIAIEEIVHLLKSISTGLTLSAANMLVFYSEESREISARLTTARLIILFLLIGMLYYLKRSDKDVLKRKEKYYRYLELVLIFTLGSIRYAVFFQRSIFFLALIGMPLIINFFNSEKISKNIKNLIQLIIIITSLGMLANQIYGFIVGYF